MASINPKTSILGFDNAAHLLRRACFSVTKTQINQFALLTPQQATTALFNFSFVPNTPLDFNNLTYMVTVSNPTVQNTNGNDDNDGHTMHWLYKAGQSQTIEYKLALWLHLCFTISDDATNYFLAYDSKELLRYHVKDNLKNLANRITRNAHMGIYLDNRLNSVNNLNENYAREFLELFTILKGPQIGAGNYTNYQESDVQQAAKVFTGFGLNPNTVSMVPRINLYNPVTLIPHGVVDVNLHNQSNKTFSAAFSNATITGATTDAGMEIELSDFVTMVFNQPATAISYSRRLYRYFVGRNITTEIEQDIITPLSQTLLNNNYNIELAVKQLLTSQHFYDEDDTINGDNTIGALVKSPLELWMHILTVFKIPMPSYTSNAKSITQFYDLTVRNLSSTCGFPIFGPNSVNGYAAYSTEPHYDKNWINTTSLYLRYTKIIDQIITGITYNGFTYKLDTAPYVKNSGNFSNPADPELLVQDFYDLLLTSAPTGARHDYFKNTLLGGLSLINWQNEWQNYITTNNSSSVKIKLDALVKALVKSPEFQIK